MEKTSQYQLNQWAAEDRILREDFNRDNANVEAGLVALGERVTAEQSAREAAITAEQEARDSAVTAAKNEAAASDAQLNAVKVEIATGYYRGNGAESRFISLGRTPKALLLFRSHLFKKAHQLFLIFRKIIKTTIRTAEHDSWLIHFKD